MRMAVGDRFPVVLRARRIDEWAKSFLAEHREATVLQLGCGMDSRAFRLAPDSGARWYDVDLPEVAELRRQVYEKPSGYQLIGASVTEREWLEEIPNDRPTLVIAEGLFMYLTEADVRGLLSRITERFPSGALLFDGMAGWGVWTSNHMVGKFKSFRMGWGISDPRTLEGWDPRLRYREQFSVYGNHERIPDPVYRLVHRALHALPATRDLLRVFRFEF